MKLPFFFLSVLISLSSLAVISAPLIDDLDRLGTFKQNAAVTLTQNCVNSTYSNISRIIYPNSSFALDIQTVMTKSGDDYNYSYSLTNPLEQYLVYGTCDENGVKTNWAYNFNITPTGGDRINSLGTFLILMLVSISILGMAMVFRNGYVGFIAGCLFLVTGIYIMIYGLGNLSDEWTRSVSYVVLGMGLIFCVSAGIEIIGDVGYGIGMERDDD